MKNIYIFFQTLHLKLGKNLIKYLPRNSIMKVYCEAVLVQKLVLTGRKQNIKVVLKTSTPTMVTFSDEYNRSLPFFMFDSQFVSF